MALVVAPISQPAIVMIARRSGQELVFGARRASRDLVMSARRRSQDLTAVMTQASSDANTLQLYRRFSRSHPKTANATVGAFCAFVGDAIAQKMQADEETFVFDWKRSAKFTAFNFVWMGGPLRSYCALLDRSRVSGMTKLAATSIIFNPFIYMPGYYFGLGVLRGETLTEISSKMEEEAPTTLVRCTAFWTPASAVQYSMVPAALQIPFLAAMSIVWSVMLASQG